MRISKSGDYEKDKEGYKRRAKKSYENSYLSADKRIKNLLTVAKSRAKRKGIEFSINHNHIKWNDICPVLGTPIKLEKSGGRQGRRGNYNAPSIDRINNSYGYIVDNVRLISLRANQLKSDMTKEECELLFRNWDKI